MLNCNLYIIHLYFCNLAFSQRTGSVIEAHCTQIVVSANSWLHGMEISSIDSIY